MKESRLLALANRMCIPVCTVQTVADTRRIDTHRTRHNMNTYGSIPD